MVRSLFRQRLVITASCMLLVTLALFLPIASQRAHASSSIVSRNASQISAGVQSAQIAVSSTVQWVDTGVTLSAGDTLKVSATGSWSADPTDGFTTPDGYTQAVADNFLNLTDLGACTSCASTPTPHWGALIGYIGNNPPVAGSYTSTSVLSEAQKVFVVGSTFQSSAKPAGLLWLAFNDDAYSGYTSDNAGQVTTTVNVTSVSKPLGGAWISPGNNFVVATGTTFHFAAHAYGGAGVDHVNFTVATGKNPWFVACRVTTSTLGTTDIYECNWNLKNGSGKVIPNGPFQVGFDVYDRAGKRILSPNGVRAGSIKQSTIKPGGIWVRTINDAANFDIGPFTLIARAYPTHSSDPRISHVNFTAFWGGRWHILCTIPNNGPNLGDYYYCSTNLFADGGYPKNEPVIVSFDVYDIAKHVNYSPNGTFTVHVNTIIADATTTGLNIGGKVLETLGGVADCLLSGIPQGEAALIEVNAVVHFVHGIAEIISKGNTARIIVKDITNGQYYAASFDFAASYSNVPGMACDDAVKTLHSLKWLNWLF